MKFQSVYQSGDSLKNHAVWSAKYIGNKLQKFRGRREFLNGE